MADDVLVEMGFDLLWLEEFHLIGDGLFLDDIEAEAYAFVADIGIGAGDEFFNDIFGPAAKEQLAISLGCFFVMVTCIQGFVLFALRI